MAVAACHAGDETQTKPQVKVLNRLQIAGPAKGESRAVWIEAMRKWREDQREKCKYTGKAYDLPEVQWAHGAFMQPLMMVEERTFYDPAAGKYTVEKYLGDLESRYGGIDLVLVWPAYPNIGVDNRNQFDLLRDLPGGLDGVRRMVADFHRLGVRVFFPVNPWDMGTRDEGEPMAAALAGILKATEADGIFGDTMGGVGKEYLEAWERLGLHPVLEPEGAMNLPALEWNLMGWLQAPDQALPTVSMYRWFEPRHMDHVAERWASDRAAGLQMAYFNGMGYMTWENIWGLWNGVTLRDGQALRRVRKIQHAVSALLTSPDWEPHVAGADADVYASVFPGKGRAFYAIISRAAQDLPAAKVTVRAGSHYLDLWNGLELKPAAVAQASSLPHTVVVNINIEARGYGGVLVLENDEIPAAIQKMMQECAPHPSLSPGGRGWGEGARLSSFSNEWKVLPQEMAAIAPTKSYHQAPEGMVAIPAGYKRFHFKVSGVEIESLRRDKLDSGVDVQYPWEKQPQRAHDQVLDMKAFYMDRTPVTNEQFKKFLSATGYKPKDEHNFLKDWTAGNYPAGWAKKPVTWVSLEDAREYAKWAGKRLPHEWEWQYAAQGADGRKHPWGNEDNVAQSSGLGRHDPEDRGTNKDAVPQPQNGRKLLPPDDVDAHPRGASPFGVLDMAGNVWQWTDEYSDEHTRAAVLRGGSSYRPSGSHWYFPPTPNLDQHAKYLLMAPCRDRSAMIGFRCAADAE